MTDAELENRKILLKSFIFRDSPPEALDELARTVQSRVARPNEIIFKEGDPPDAFYIIGSGRVRIFVRHKDRIERELSVRGPGEHFGEVALLAGDTRTANAESLVETQLVVFSKEQFDRLLRDYPDLSRNFVREMRGWLLKDQEIIEEEADAVIRASRVSWFDFVLVIGVSVLLAITFNFSNPYGIPLVPERPEASCFDQRLCGNGRLPAGTNAHCRRHAQQFLPETAHKGRSQHANGDFRYRLPDEFLRRREGQKDSGLRKYDKQAV